MEKQDDLSHKFDEDLVASGANYIPLTPTRFLQRTAQAFPNSPAIIHGELTRSWAETYDRCCRFAESLREMGVQSGTVVAVLAPNIPALLELHFSVPLAGAILNAINFRLDAATVAYILDHSEAAVVLVDSEFAELLSDALRLCVKPPRVIDIEDHLAPQQIRIGSDSYEAMISRASGRFHGVSLANEWDTISINYTSGTTGHPKGVVYHHRGAYLNSVGDIIAWGMGKFARYLWTLPMFHCNGWCFPWAVTMVAGVHICLRRFDGEILHEMIEQHRVTHLCGAPIVMNMLVNAPQAEAVAARGGFSTPLAMMAAAAAPPAALLDRMEQLGVSVTHAYGLTEVYGPVMRNEPQQQWLDLPREERFLRLARQGFPFQTLEAAMVADAKTMAAVPKDGTTIGEIFLRGNTVAKGYLKSPEATAAAFGGGWFHSGDLAVWHEDGTIEIKDRSKDIIISGGENISTLEIESVLYRHPLVLEAAVVAKPDEKWGETPCAFVSLKIGIEAGRDITTQQMIDYCREHMAHFKCPTAVVFGALEKTSTGKIQKYLLRERAKSVP